MVGRPCSADTAAHFHPYRQECYLFYRLELTQVFSNQREITYDTIFKHYAYDNVMIRYLVRLKCLNYSELSPNLKYYL